MEFKLTSNSHLRTIDNMTKKNDNSSRECPTCNSSNTTVVAQMSAQQIINSSPYYDESWYERLQVKPESLFGVSKCDDCQFVFSSQVPDDEFLDKIYGSSDSLDSGIAVFARPARAAFAYHSYATLLDAIAEHMQKDDRGVVSEKVKILDIGCAFGTGSLGLAVEGYPYEVFGVEWSQATRDYLAKQGMHTYKTLDDVDSTLKFDGIILNDVLEHVPDPVAFVSKLANHCHKNTAVWVNVPDFIEWRLNDILAQMRQGSMNVPTDMNPWEHLSYFTPQSLTNLMAGAGFKRWDKPHVDYKISRGSLLNTIKSALRTLRDSWRIYKGSYPNDYQTSGIFLPTDNLESRG